MLTKSNIKNILEAMSGISPELVLSRMTYEHGLIFNKEEHHTIGDWYYSCAGTTLSWPPINLLNPDTDPVEFYNNYIMTGKVNVTRIATVGVHEVPYKVKYNLKAKTFRVYIYENSEEALNLIGKNWSKFRSAKKYLDNEHFTIEQYTQDNHIPYSLLGQMDSVFRIWREYEDMKGYHVNYDVSRALKNLYEFGESMQYLTTVVRYKGEIVHYQTSERLNDNYIILSDIKPNFGLSKEVQAEFKYTSRLIHWMHMTHWNNLLPEHKKGSTIYYNIGDADIDSFKNQLNPTMVMHLKYTPFKLEEPEAVKPNSLF